MSNSPDELLARYADHQTVATRHGRLAYTSSGRGPPIVLVHGIPLSLITWRKLAPRLEERHRILAIDMLGYGFSEKPKRAYETQVLIESLAEACATLGVTCATFVGHSFGAGIVLWLAHDHPDLVDRMVLLNSVSYPGGAHSLEKLMRKSLLRSMAAMTLRFDPVSYRVFSSKLSSSYFDASRQERAIGKAYYALLRRDAGEDSYLSTLAHFDEDTLAALIPKVEQPTLLISGDSDRILPTENAQRMASEMRRAQLITLEKTGHMPQEEEPARVAELIARFVQE